MKKSLIRVIEWSAMNPGYVQDWCKHWFEHVQVGYLRDQGKVQVACFDDEGKCRLLIHYQYLPRSGLWSYDILPGNKYNQPEAENDH